MELVYTDIRNPLTQYLTDTAAEFAKEGKRVLHCSKLSIL